MVPIDMDNGSFKSRGARILVLPKYKEDAKSVYEEFRQLTQREDDQMEDAVMEDDETMVNSNLKGNGAQLWVIFETTDFPMLETEELETGHKKAARQQEERVKERTGSSMKSAADERTAQGDTNNKSTHRAMKGGILNSKQSYKVVVTQRAEMQSDGSKSTRSSDRRKELMELKSLIETMNQMMQEHNTAMMISRNEAKASTRQVQRLTNI